jgi:Tripartite tricarboxylate transporter family receptor
MDEAGFSWTCRTARSSCSISAARNSGKTRTVLSRVGSTATLLCARRWVSTHLTMEAMNSALHLDIAHIPFRGTSQAVPALLRNHVRVLWASYPNLKAGVRPPLSSAVEISFDASNLRESIVRHAWRPWPHACFLHRPTRLSLSLTCAKPAQIFRARIILLPQPSRG